MSIIEFFSPGTPPATTHQEHKVAVVLGRPRIYQPKAVREARTRLVHMVRDHTPVKPLDGPLRVTVIWIFPHLSSTPKSRRGEYIRMDRKPDTGNLNKALMDIMERLGYYVNDSRITTEHTEKYRGPIPGLYVRIEPDSAPITLPEVITGGTDHD